MADILLIDDEPDILSSMSRILRRNGYTVDTASTLSEARTRDNWSDYFAILLDRKLPDGTGDEFIPRLKLLAPQAAVIVITAYGDLESSLVGLRNGVEDYLLKPIEPEVVLHRLRRIKEMQTAKMHARQAERLAAIGQTMAAIAHESRNALQRIQAAAEMLELEFPDNALALGEIRRIESATESLKLLLEEVREYAAPIKLDLIRCNIAKIWRRAWREAIDILPACNITLDERIDSTDLDCSVDPFRLQQVFRNLFENAIAACPKQDARIEVLCKPSRLSEQAALEIVVRDNGSGIPAQDLNKVFDPFFTTRPQGTGLGMAIVKRIVEAHRGVVEINPHSKQGAEVTMQLFHNSPA